MLPATTHLQKYHGAVHLDGRLIVEQFIALKPNGRPDHATSLLIRLAEETLDRRIIGEAHQLPGETITISLKRLPTHGQPQ